MKRFTILMIFAGLMAAACVHASQPSQMPPSEYKPGFLTRWGLGWTQRGQDRFTQQSQEARKQWEQQTGLSAEAVEREMSKSPRVRQLEARSRELAQKKTAEQAKIQARKSQAQMQTQARAAKRSLAQQQAQEELQAQTMLARQRAEEPGLKAEKASLLERAYNERLAESMAESPRTPRSQEVRRAMGGKRSTSDMSEAEARARRLQAYEGLEMPYEPRRPRTEDEIRALTDAYAGYSQDLVPAETRKQKMRALEKFDPSAMKTGGLSSTKRWVTPNAPALTLEQEGRVRTPRSEKEVEALAGIRSTQDIDFKRDRALAYENQDRPYNYRPIGYSPYRSAFLQGDEAAYEQKLVDPSGRYRSVFQLEDEAAYNKLPERRWIDYITQKEGGLRTDVANKLSGGAEYVSRIPGRLSSTGKYVGSKIYGVAADQYRREFPKARVLDYMQAYQERTPARSMTQAAQDYDAAYAERKPRYGNRAWELEEAYGVPYWQRLKDRLPSMPKLPRRKPSVELLPGMEGYPNLSPEDRERIAKEIKERRVIETEVGNEPWYTRAWESTKALPGKIGSGVYNRYQQLPSAPEVYEQYLKPSEEAANKPGYFERFKNYVGSQYENWQANRAEAAAEAAKNKARKDYGMR